MLGNLKKHWEVAKEAYRREKEIAGQKLPVHQKDFLPAALAVMEKPASPAGRTTVWVIVALFSIAIAWGFIGKVDVVAVARGEVITRGQTKTVQPFQTGVVNAIYVTNGTRVEKGDILVELDSTANTADVTQLRRQRQAALLTQARNRWILDRLESDADGSEEPFTVPVDVDPKVAGVQELLAASQLNEYRATQAAYTQQRHERESELAVVNNQVNKLNETLPLLQEQVDGMAELSADGITARFQYLDYQESLISRQKDLVIQQDRVQQVQASIVTLAKQREQHHQEFKKQVVSELAEATENLVAVEQELIKAEQSSDFQRLRAPVDGVVQQLSVHTIGGVVSTGDPLMVVVPAERNLEVEAEVLNKDVGFVFPGQPAEVKLEAFPFTKYGVIHGEIESMDLAAVEDEELGLVYPTRIAIDKSTMQVDGRTVNLTPGMSLTTEIKVGKRRLIEFLLAPLLRYKDEALRER